MTIRISCIAKPRPTQFIGPEENGMNAASLWTSAPAASGVELEVEATGSRALSSGSCPDAISHRSGQKVSGKEKLRASRWRVNMGV